MVVGRFPSGRATSCQSFAIVVVAVVGISKAKQYTRVAFAHLTRARVSLRTPRVSICVSGEATNKRREKKVVHENQINNSALLKYKGERGQRTGQTTLRRWKRTGPAEGRIGRNVARSTFRSVKTKIELESIFGFTVTWSDDARASLIVIALSVEF